MPGKRDNPKPFAQSDLPLFCPGLKFGKKKKLSLEQVAELQRRRAQGELIKTLMEDYGLSKASVYRYLSEISQASQE